MTTVTQDPARISFHEATLIGISRCGDVVDLALNDVHIADARGAIDVGIEGVRGILYDGSPVEKSSYGGEDGEILTLREEGDQVLMVVQWNDFTTRRRDTMVYNLLGGKVVLRVPPSKEA